MAKNLKQGDKVEWNSHGGTAEGEVKKKITKPTKIKGHEAKASPESPQFVVKSNKGGEAAHKSSALKKKSS